MDKRYTVAIAVVSIIALFVIGYVYFKSATLDQEESAQGDLSWQDAKAVLPSPEAELMRIDAKYSYERGSYTVVGDVNLPNPCMILEATPIVETGGKNVLIELIANQKTDEACPQVVTKARFKVKFTADEKAKITARYNGSMVVLNLILARPGEDIENAEIFIKG